MHRTVGADALDVSCAYPTSKGTVPAISVDAVPVYFYNKSTACHLLAPGPSINAVKNTTNVREIKASDLSFSSPVPGYRRVVIEHHKKIEALFLFGNAVARPGRQCDPATSTGALVQGYANPVHSVGEFFPRKIPEVCFDSGAGADWSDTGAAWAWTN